MNDKKIAESENLGCSVEWQRYILGGAFTTVLTLAAFALVGWGALSRDETLIAVSVLALAQIAAHFHFFMHIDLWKSHRDDLLLVLFTALIVLLMVGGTILILFNQWSRMV